MNIDLKDAGDARKVATVTFEADEIAEREKAVCNDFAKQVNIPGFRKGKVPTGVVRQRFGKEMADELKRRISTDAYDAVVKRDDVRVYSVLKVDADIVSADSTTTVEVTIDVEPEFEIPDFNEFEVTIHPTDVSEEEVEKELSGICDQRASYETVEREVKAGDFVKCSYDGTLDDKAVAELVPEKPILGKQSNTWEEAASSTGLGVPAIVEGLVGMKAGDKKTVEENFAEDFELPPLAGKTVSYELEVHEVREKNAPNPDDAEFLKGLKAESLEDLKEKILKDIESRKEYQNNNSKRNQVTQQLIEKEEFPLPQKAVEEEANAIFQGMAQSGLQQGVERNEIESKKDELWQQAQARGQARVKLGIILGRIAEQEEIKVTNEDLAQAATREALARREDPSAYVQQLSKDRGRMARLQRDVLHDKTLELVASKAKETICEIEGDHEH